MRIWGVLREHLHSIPVGPLFSLLSLPSPQAEGYFLYTLPRAAVAIVVAISYMWLFKLKYQSMNVKYNKEIPNISVIMAKFHVLYR